MKTTIPFGNSDTHGVLRQQKLKKGNEFTQGVQQVHENISVITYTSLCITSLISEYQNISLITVMKDKKKN